MVNLPAKFEVSIFSRYGDMNCIKNAQNGRDSHVFGYNFASLGVAPWDQRRSIGLFELILQTCDGETLRRLVFPLFANFIWDML